MPAIRSPFENGHFYHVYTRGNNRELIFQNADNCRYFLELYARSLGSTVDTYAYCLLGNHLHLLFRIREDVAVPAAGPHPVSRQLANLFNAYAKAFNRQTNRRGSLFQEHFGRRRVETDAYLTRLIYYLHVNPERHGLTADFRTWPFSSYRSHLSEQTTRLARAAVLEWFGGLSAYREFHDLAHAEEVEIALLSKYGALE